MTGALEHVFDELEDGVDDFENAHHERATAGLERIVGIIDAEPLASLLLGVLPKVDFPTWWQSCQADKRGMVGSGSLAWPSERCERVAMQLGLCRTICRGEENLSDVAIAFCYAGTGISVNILSFSEKILRPLCRDIGRLADLRVTPPVLDEALASTLPETGDATLDNLLQSARDQFRSQDPAVRRSGLQKLWDAWERTKTLDGDGDKRSSIDRLLRHAAEDSAFRGLLDLEARALTDIGNQYEIRHFETSTHPIPADAHVDYLFHRMWCLLLLLLSSRARAR